MITPKQSELLVAIKSTLSNIVLKDYSYFIILGSINTYRTATGALLADLLVKDLPNINHVSIVNAEIAGYDFFEALYTYGCDLDFISKVLLCRNASDLTEELSQILLHDNLHYERNIHEKESWKDDYINIKGTEKTIKIPYNLRYNELLQLMNNPTRIGKVLVIVNSRTEDGDLSCVTTSDPKDCIAVKEFFDKKNRPYL